MNLGLHLGTPRIGQLIASGGGGDPGNVVNPTMTDADAIDYVTRLLAAGSTMTGANQLVVEQMIKDLKTAGLWSPIYLAGLLVGFNGFQGCFVPFRRFNESTSTTYSLTNYNFASSDHSRLGGLTGGTGKWIDTSLSENDLRSAAYFRHYMAVISGTSSASAYGPIITNKVNFGSSITIYLGQDSSRNSLFQDGGASSWYAAESRDTLFGVIRRSGAGALAYPSLVSPSSFNQTSPATPQNMAVFTDGNGSYGTQTLKFFSIGSRLFPATSSSAQLSYYNTFNTIVTTAIAALT